MKYEKKAEEEAKVAAVKVRAFRLFAAKPPRSECPLRLRHSRARGRLPLTRPSPSALSQAEEARRAACKETEAQREENERHVDMRMEDADLEAVRQARLAALKAASKGRQQNLNDGHGELREIAEDDFLKEVTSTKCVWAQRDVAGSCARPPHPRAPLPLPPSPPLRAPGTSCCTSTTRSS